MDDIFSMNILKAINNLMQIALSLEFSKPHPTLDKLSNYDRNTFETVVLTQLHNNIDFTLEFKSIIKSNNVAMNHLSILLFVYLCI